MIFFFIYIFLKFFEEELNMKLKNQNSMNQNSKKKNRPYCAKPTYVLIQNSNTHTMKISKYSNSQINQNIA